MRTTRSPTAEELKSYLFYVDLEQYFDELIKRHLETQSRIESLKLQIRLGNYRRTPIIDNEVPIYTNDDKRELSDACSRLEKAEIDDGLVMLKLMDRLEIIRNDKK